MTVVRDPNHSTARNRKAVAVDLAMAAIPLLCDALRSAIFPNYRPVDRPVRTAPRIAIDFPPHGLAPHVGSKRRPALNLALRRSTGGLTRPIHSRWGGLCATLVLSRPMLLTILVVVRSHCLRQRQRECEY
jgi:hypothetical protein